MKRKYLEKAAAITLAAVMVTGSALSVLGKTNSDAGQSAKETTDKEADSFADAGGKDKKESSPTKDKEETVYVTADAAGNPTKTEVSVTLKNPGDTDEIEDYTTLSDIKNKEGDEEYTQKSDGTLLWENHGEDIQYEGTSDQDLPLSVKVTYYLDGKKISADEIAGKSGSVKIRFDYENHTTAAVKADDETVAVPFPFLVFSTAFLSEDVFSDIEVTNGKVLSMDGEAVALGYALPGVADSLNLGDFEPTEGLELPEYVEITAQTDNFKLDFTATVVTGGLFSELEDEDFQDLDELTDDMEELSEASQELVEGTDALYDGIVTFASYLAEYASGMEALADGSSQLTAGIQTLYENTAAIQSGAAALQSGLEGINGALANVSVPASQSGLEEVITAASAFMADTVGVATQVSSLNGFLAQAEQVNASIQQAASELSQIPASSWQITAGNPAYENVKNYLEGTDLPQEMKDGILAQIPQTITADGMNSEAYAQVTAIAGSLESLSLTVPDLSEMNALAQDMETQLQIISAHGEELAGISDSLSAMSGYVEELKGGIAALTAGSAKLSAGMEAFGQGMEQLYGGSVTLTAGAATLAGAGGAMGEGLAVLSEGMLALRDGFTEFDEEGIQKLADLAGEDLHDVIVRLKALKKADASYTNFSGIQDGKTGSVRFIIETDGIDPEKTS